MATDNTPLDERLYSLPGQNAWYMGHGENPEFRMPWMGEDMIHHYFRDSPFFDWTTKNGMDLKQAQTDPFNWARVHDRKKFEDGLAERIGTEFMIVEGEGMQFDKEYRPVKGGVWVIRKQERTKDSLETLGTYFIVGENVYQAPSVGDILGTRLLSASTALSKCFSQAATLPQWSPTTGHTYPTTAVANKNAGTSASSATTPAASTPGFEREPSLAAESNSQRAGSSVPGGIASSNRSAATSDAMANWLLRDSMQKSFTYGDDPFTDENPLQGEPGNLTFVTSTAAAKKKKADAEAAATKAKEDALQAAAAAVAATAAAAEAAALAAASKPATPAASPTTPGGKIGKKVKKDKKRRKSKHDAQSPPMSPTEGTPAATPAPVVG
jgi:mediator of RNA polymerase II transcription subunit 6